MCYPVPRSFVRFVPLSSRFLFSVQETNRKSFEFSMLKTLSESLLPVG